MHQLGDTVMWDPFPPHPNVDDQAHRHDANRAIGVSGLGLGLTGLIELAFALLSGSVGLLGDALHNLRTSRPPWRSSSGSRYPSALPHLPILMASIEPRTSPVSAWPWPFGPARSSLLSSVSTS
jgi:hypothetical protein